MKEIRLSNSTNVALVDDDDYEHLAQWGGVTTQIGSDMPSDPTACVDWCGCTGSLKTHQKALW